MQNISHENGDFGVLNVELGFLEASFDVLNGVILVVDIDECFDIIHDVKDKIKITCLFESYFWHTPYPAIHSIHFLIPIMF